jgi:hypothetical protein
MVFQHLKFEDNKTDENWKPIVFFARAFKPACIFLSKTKNNLKNLKKKKERERREKRRRITTCCCW